jgi:hypothetical protein
LRTTMVSVSFKSKSAPSGIVKISNLLDRLQALCRPVSIPLATGTNA